MGDILPFVSAAVWMALGAWPLTLGKASRYPQMALSLFAIALGVWALLDGILLQGAVVVDGLLTARLRATAAALSALGFVWFAKWLTRTRSAWDLLFVAPVAAAIVAEVLGGIIGLAPEPWGFRIVRDPAVPPMLLFVASSYLLVGLAVILWSSRVLREDRALVLRMGVLSAAILLSFAVAYATDIPSGLAGGSGPRMLSSFLFVPGLMIAATLLSLSRTRIHEALRRIVLSSDRAILAAALLDADGTIYGMAASPKAEHRKAFDLPEVLIGLGRLIHAMKGGAERPFTWSIGQVTFFARRGSGHVLLLAVKGTFNDVLVAEVERFAVALESEPSLMDGLRLGLGDSFARLRTMLRELVHGAPAAQT